MSEITLGATYVDKITGFRGVATGHCTYLTGCSQGLLVPKANPDGASADGRWIDVQRLEVDRTVPVITINNSRTPGCDIAAPVR